MLRVLFRLARVIAHLGGGVLTALFVYQRLTAAEQDRRLVAWAARFIAILAIELRVIGTPPAPGQGVVLVGNHTSWLDIHTLHALLPARFISKAEVRHWPLVGRLAEVIGTLFITRERRRDAQRVNQIMVERLHAGQCLAFFPEGTTSDGSQLLPFYPALFQPAIDAGVAVTPVALRYLMSDGAVSAEAGYHGDMSLAESFRRIAKLDRLVAEVNFLPPIATTGKDRKQLAVEAAAALREALGLNPAT